MDNNLLFKSEPSQSSWRGLVWKVFVWLVIGGIIAILLFLILSFVWWIFTNTSTQISWFSSANPILSLIILLIWFLCSFIGNLAMAWSYSLFFQDRYFKTTKIMWILLLTNWILFLFFTPIYLVFGWEPNTLFLVLWWHIIFSIFLSSQQLETISNPNYSASSLVGNTLWFVLTILIYSLIRKWSEVWGIQNQTYLLLLMPPVIWFTIIPLFLWIRERIYHKMYEIWNNWFYTAPNQEEKWNDNLIWNSHMPNENDDINVDLN